MTLTPREEQEKIVSDSTSRIAIDILQAKNYFVKSQYEGYEKNLRDAIADLEELIGKTKDKID